MNEYTTTGTPPGPNLPAPPFPPAPTRTPDAQDARAGGPTRRRYRPGGPDEVAFYVAPMLDMAFQLLAFFILTFKAPSAETRVDLDLPAAPVALPASAEGQASARPARRSDTDLENDLLVRARADDLGDLKTLQLGSADVPDLDALGQRLRRYVQLLDGRPLRVRLVADDQLRYEPAVQLISVCSSAGAAAIRLSPPGATPELSNGPELKQ